MSLLPWRGDHRVRISRIQAAGRFGDAVVTIPRAEAPVGLVVVIPGYTGHRLTIAWFARLARAGVAIATIGTVDRRDHVAARTEQLLAALDHLTTDSRTSERIDASRLGVIGHSMGGSAALAAAARLPEIRAVAALTPWSNAASPQAGAAPTLVIGAEDDRTAPPAAHARRIFDALPAGAPRAYLELRGASHYAPLLRPNPLIERAVGGWMARFVARDPAAAPPEELIARLDARRLVTAITRP